MLVEEARERFDRAVNWYAYIKAMYGDKPEHAGDVQLAFEDLLTAGDAYNVVCKAVSA